MTTPPDKAVALAVTSAPTLTLRSADREVSDLALAKLAASIPANTRRAYTRWLRDFAEWCDEHDRNALPATAETLLEYVAALSETDLGASSLRQAIAAVRSGHEAAGYPEQPPAYLARKIARGHARERAEAGVRIRQAPPIRLEHLHRMVGVCDPDSLRGSRDRLLLGVGWGALLRRSEIVGLRVDDVRHCRDRADGVDVFIASSKTDKESVGRTTNIPVGIHELSNVPPMLDAYLAARDRAGLDGGPLFRSIETGGRIGAGMTGDAVNDLIKDLARRAGLPDWASYSAHGVRSGGATEMYLAGSTLDQIIEQGRWAPGSTVVIGYIRAAERARRNGMRGVM